MTTDLESKASVDEAKARSYPFGWLKVGVVAAGSAFLGGLAAAWFYRKTLARLQQAEGQLQNSESKRAAGTADSEEQA